MNKKQLLASVLALPLLMGGVAQAKLFTKAKRSTIAKSANATGNARKTATDSRLVAWTYREYNATDAAFQISDSSRYHYSNGRGSNLKTEEIKYDSLFSWVNVSGAYENDAKTLLTYDANNNVLTDTYLEWDGNTNAYVNNDLRTYTYAQGKVASTLDQDWNDANNVWENTSKSEYTYTNGNLTTIEDKEWNGTTWDNYSKSTLTYNSDNTLATEVYEAWDNNAWINRLKYEYTYTNGKQVTAVISTWSQLNSAWSNSYKNTYTYDNNGNRVADTAQTGSGTTWDNDYVTTYTYDAGNNALTETRADWNATTSLYENNVKHSYTYNSYNQPTSILEESWNSANTAWEHDDYDEKSSLYYETYTTSVAQTTQAATAIQLFPVPARNEVSLNINWGTPQAFTVTIYDAQGKNVNTFSENSGSQYRKSISVANLAAGNYFMSITTTTGRVATKRFSVVK